MRRRAAADGLWEPFTAPIAHDSRIERHLYKNVTGNRLIFEEIDPDLQLAFRARWSACEEFGLVCTATLVNLGTRPVAAVALDGLRNLPPHGVPLALQQQSSCLVDAYKRCEYDDATRLGIFALTAKIIDRAEPAEELRANTVWCAGLERFDVSLSIQALAAFRRGEILPVALLESTEGPSDPLHTQAFPDDRILRDVPVIIVANKIESDDLPVHRSGDDDEGQSDQDGLSVFIHACHSIFVLLYSPVP